MGLNLRVANLKDMAEIFQLYAKAYDGTYPDPTFSSAEKLTQALNRDDVFIFVADDQNFGIIASILFRYQTDSKLSKAGAAVVLPDFRGQNITQSLLDFGINHIKRSTKGLDVLYITTRTVHKAAQVLTQKMGFKQLGIFPNVHKTKEYETHALAALHFNDSLERRFVDFEQHPKVLPLFNIVRENIDLPVMKEAEIWNKKKYLGKVPILEVIEAAEFVKHRANQLAESHEIDLGFFPFHIPNLLITSPEQKIEVFAYVNEVDKHCVITGLKIDREVSFTDLFLTVSNILRDRGIRYIEIIIRANRLNIIDKICHAKFVPCGYVPAFQFENDKRYDYVVFSRSYEILDFNNLELTGANERYLGNYIKLWEESFLAGYFKNDYR